MIKNCQTPFPFFIVPLLQISSTKSSWLASDNRICSRLCPSKSFHIRTSILFRAHQNPKRHPLNPIAKSPDTFGNDFGLPSEPADTISEKQDIQQPIAQSNYLISETSRYLSDSANDVVRWYPWGEKAFEVARTTQKPIFLSSGFFSCHICDVMSAHFADPEISNILNKEFICVKVDRTERPDVDSVYSFFVQIVSGRNGWPLTCFLTPTLIPFIGTTYLTQGQLKRAIKSIPVQWEKTPDELEANGKKVIDALRDMFVRKPAAAQKPVTMHTLSNTFDAAVSSFDVKHGGFGAVPKFPRPSVFEFLLSLHQSKQLDDRIRSESLSMVLDSLRHIADGGIHDHIGGGFHRYSLDDAWQVPNFEKTLSDQAQLAMSFLDAYLLTGEEQFRQIVFKTLDFVIREMRDSETGIFYSSMHSDSQPLFDITNTPSAGAFYTFSLFELRLILGEPAGTIFLKRFGVTTEGNISNSPVAKAEYDGLDGLNVLRISSPISEIANEMNISEEEVIIILQESIAKVLAQREQRPRPPVDDLAVISWTSLAISAFTRAGAALGRPDYIRVATKGAEVIREKMCVFRDPNTDSIYLARAYRKSRGKMEALAEDYAYAIQAFLDCFEVTGNSGYALFARQLQNTMDQEFWDDDGYGNCRKGDANILLRRIDNYDSAEPAASSVTVLNLLRMASLFGDTKLEERARLVTNSFGDILNSTPLSMPMLLVSALPLMTKQLKNVIIVGDNEEASHLLRVLWSRRMPRFVSLLRLPLQENAKELTKYLSPQRRWLAEHSKQNSCFVCTGDEFLEATEDPDLFLAQLNEL